jgi:hypothetical protein
MEVQRAFVSRLSAVGDTVTIIRIITHVKTFAWNQFCCTIGAGKLQGRVAAVGGSENRE